VYIECNLFLSGMFCSCKISTDKHITRSLCCSRAYCLFVVVVSLGFDFCFSVLAKRLVDESIFKKACCVLSGTFKFNLVSP